MRYHFAATRKAPLETTVIQATPSLCYSEAMARGEVTHTAGGSVDWCKLGV